MAGISLLPLVCWSTLDNALLGDLRSDIPSTMSAVIAALLLDDVEYDPRHVFDKGFVKVLVGVPWASGRTIAGADGGLDEHLLIRVLDILERCDEALGLQLFECVFEDRVVHVQSSLEGLGPDAVAAGVVDQGVDHYLFVGRALLISTNAAISNAILLPNYPEIFGNLLVSFLGIAPLPYHLARVLTHSDEELVIAQRLHHASQQQ